MVQAMQETIAFRVLLFMVTSTCNSFAGWNVLLICVASCAPAFSNREKGCSSRRPRCRQCCVASAIRRFAEIEAGIVSLDRKSVV